MLKTIDPALPWYVARAGGLVAWALATATIVWGLLLSSNLIRRRGLPPRLLDLHRHLGALTLAFTAVHVAGLWADRTVTFGAREILVPMASQWRPGAVAWGVVAAYVLVAVQVTSWTKRHLPRRLWRWVHLGAVPMYAVATIHGFQSGSDKGNTLVEWCAFAGVSAVVFVGAFRVTFDRATERPVAARPRTASSRAA